MNYYNYYTEVEEHFISRRGKHLFLAPLDWHLIAVWKSSGIPLNVALRGIDIAMDSWHAKRSRIGDRLSSLAYCHESVMQEYARHLESHLGEAIPSGVADESRGTGTGLLRNHDVANLIQKRISEITMAREKHLLVEAGEGMDRAIQRLTEIGALLESRETDFETIERDLGMIEQILVDALQKAIPAQQAAEWEQESRKDLKVYKKRLPKAVFEKIRADYMREKIRKFFQIGELSLYRL